jgi:MFS transporter, Spinster family, sphingosine-1-phosphate transporter
MIKNRTAILVLLTGLNLLNYVDRMIVAAVLKKIKAPEIEGGLDLSNSQAGLLATAFLLGYFLTSPLFGARADKGSRKGLIAIGVAVWSVATMASGIADTFMLMIAARVFVGVGEASYATLAPTIIDDLTPPEQKGRALAIFYLAIPVGSALGYVIGGFIEARWGWRAAFYICGGPGILLSLLCLLIVEPKRKLRDVRGSVIEGLRTLSKLPLFRRAVLGYCAYTAAMGAFAHWAPTFIAEQFPDQLLTKSRTALENANYYFGLTTIAAGIIGTIVGGRWADSTQRHHPVSVDTSFDDPANKRGVNALLRICAVGMIWAAPLAAVAFLMPTPLTFFAVAFLAELGLFLSTSPVNAIGLRAVPPELRASAMAAMIFAIHLFGDVWSPYALGGLRDVVVPIAAMMLLPITFAVSAFWWWPRRAEAG